MNSLRKLVAMLGGLAGMIGVFAALFVVDWFVLTPELTADVSPPDDSLRWIGIAGGVLCMAGAAGVWRAPRLSGVVLALGALAMVNGLGYTPFTLLPIGFAVTAAALAMVIALSAEG